MSELLLKYNSLDAFGKQEVMDFLEFLIQKNEAKKYAEYKQKILQVSEWTEADIKEMQKNATKINFENSEW